MTDVVSIPQEGGPAELPTGRFAGREVFVEQLRAAFAMFPALLPSRETPQDTRSSSSGMNFPQYPRMIASDAAPHSTDSICITVGVLTRLMNLF